jgi:NACHT domain
MDPLNAIGLAGNIVQFIDFSCRLFSQTQEIFNSGAGASKDTLSLVALTEDLKDLCGKLSVTEPSNRSRGVISPTPSNIRSIATRCSAAAQELLEALERIKTTKPSSKWNSFKICLKTVWNSKMIDEMESRLNSHRSQLTLQLEMLRTEENSSILAILRDLRDRSQQVEAELNERINGMENGIFECLDQMRAELSQRKMERSSMSSMPSNMAELTAKIDVNSVSCNLIVEVEGIKTSVNILKQIRFPGLRLRYDKITDPHPASCYTVFSERIVPWLEADSHLFWISGKPGSGKSTLMKYLVKQPRTITALQHWAGTRRLVTASYFFWTNGSPLQRSQEGLLRSILYDILRKNPHLIPDALPQRWNSTCKEREEVDEEPWSPSELQETIRRLTELENSKMCFVILIDGLDEYNGRHEDLIEPIQLLATVPNIKLCIASRPWNEYEVAFGKDSTQKLYMEEVNEDDIRTYVKMKLEDHQDFQHLATGDVDVSSLSSEIVQNARGVFLWVFLVVRSLISGLKNCDRLMDLKRRLREIPPDLDGFFRHIFNSLEPVYKRQAARSFQVALAAGRPLSLLNHWFIDLEEEDPEFLLKVKKAAGGEKISGQGIFNWKQRILYHQQMRRRLNARSKGLLEVAVRAVPSARIYGELFRDEYDVDFLHRTVRDFLNTEEMQTQLSNWLRAHRPDFNSNLLLCKTVLAELSCNPWSNVGHDDPTYPELETILFKSARAYHEQLKNSGTAVNSLCDVLEDLDFIACLRFPATIWTPDTLVNLTISWGLVLCIEMVVLNRLNKLGWVEKASSGQAEMQWLKADFVRMWNSVFVENAQLEDTKIRWLHTALYKSRDRFGQLRKSPPDLEVLESLLRKGPKVSVDVEILLESLCHGTKEQNAWRQNFQTLARALTALNSHGTDLSYFTTERSLRRIATSGLWISGEIIRIFEICRQRGRLGTAFSRLLEPDEGRIGTIISRFLEPDEKVLRQLDRREVDQLLTELSSAGELHF